MIEVKYRVIDYRLKRRYLSQRPFLFNMLVDEGHSRSFRGANTGSRSANRQMQKSILETGRLNILQIGSEPQIPGVIWSLLAIMEDLLWEAGHVLRSCNINLLHKH